MNRNLMEIYNLSRNIFIEETTQNILSFGCVE